jgi:F-type H+-transporting ATPase subunit epsilon
MAETFLLEIATPEKMAFSDQVEEANFPGIEGEFGVLPGHTPFLTQLKVGALQFKTGTRIEFLSVNRGFVEVTPKKVTVLTESAELRSEIDLERADAALKRAEERIKSKDEDIDFARAQASLDMAITRLKIARTSE